MLYKPTRRDTTLPTDHPVSKSDIDARITAAQKIPIDAITPTETPTQRAANPDGGTKTASHASHFRGARMKTASGRLRRGSLKALVLPQAGHLTLLDGSKTTSGVFSLIWAQWYATMVCFTPCLHNLETHGAPRSKKPQPQTRGRARRGGQLRDRDSPAYHLTNRRRW